MKNLKKLLLGLLLLTTIGYSQSSRISALTKAGVNDSIVAVTSGKSARHIPFSELRTRVLTDIETIALDTLNFNGGGHFTWNNIEYTIDLTTTLGPVIQIGQEFLSLVYNNTGGTLFDGKIIHPTNGNFTGGFSHVEYALANNHEDISGALGVLTMDIPPGQIGFATLRGRVRGIDTSGLSLGDVWISATNPGEFTSTMPMHPAYAIKIGRVAVVDAVNGEIAVNQVNTPFDSFLSFYNGTLKEEFNFLVTSDGATVTGSLQSIYSGDLTMVFSDGLSLLDCTPPQTITLTAGTDEIPVTNYVYLLKSDKSLHVSTSSWDTSQEHKKIADVVVQSAASVQTNDVYANRNWNDPSQNAIGMGGYSSDGFWIRSQPATWISPGIEGVLTITPGAPDNVQFSNTSGFMLQKNPQAVDAMDMALGKIMYVVNNFTTKNKPITDLNDELTDALGVSMSGRYFNITAMIVGNRTGEADQVFFNLPTGSYNSLVSAVSDVDGYNVDAVPEQFNGIAFVAYRYTFKHTSSGGGTWTLENTVDLRRAGGLGGGAGGGGAASFLALNDTPTFYTALAFQRANISGVALENVLASAIDVSDFNDDGTYLTQSDRSTKEQFTSSASQTIFVLLTSPNNVDVFLDRVVQIEGIDYTFAGNTVTLTNPLAIGSKVDIRKY